jgi:O-antigen ligase
MFVSQDSRNYGKVNPSRKFGISLAYEDEYYLVPAFLSFASLLVMGFFLSFAREWMGLCVVIISLLWCLKNPYIFIALVLPGVTIFSDVPIMSDSRWSVIRVVFGIIVLGIFLRPGPALHNLRFIPRYILGSLIVILCAYLLSAFTMNGLGEAALRITSHVLRIGLVVVVFIGVYSLRNSRLLLLGLVFQGILMSFAGLYIWAAEGSFMAWRIMGIGYTGGDPLLIFATYAVANASLSVSSGLACIALAESFLKNFYRFFAYILGAFLMLASIMSTRRQAVLAIVLAILLVLLFERRRNRLVLVMAIAFIAVLLSPTGYFDQFFSKRESILSEFTGQGTGRLELITTGFDFWEQSPILGYGPGSQSVLYGTLYNYFGLNTNSHNTIISALLEGGIIAAIAIFYMTIKLSLQVFRTVRSLSFGKNPFWPSLVLASLANILVYTLVTGDLLASNSFLMLVAILAAYCVRSLEKD